MVTMLRPVLVFSVLFSLVFSSSAQKCGTYKFANNKVFGTCTDLPSLNSFLHWNYESSSGSLEIAFRQTGIAASSWAAWAINPKSSGSAMVGAQSIVAYQLSNGTMRAYTSPISSYSTSMPEGKLSYDVSGLKATYAKNEMIIYAIVALPKNSTTIRQVWQQGPVSSDLPGAHAFAPANTNSFGNLDLLSGNSAPSGGGDSRTRNKNIHGVLNAVSWGVLMPIGVMSARYMRVFKSADPAWFYIHVTCQTSAYVIGVAGWATGLKLGAESSGIEYSVHRTIGILLFLFATLQVFALLLRPNKDHKYRLYWNIYHHSIGYSVIVLSIVNILKGFDILNPEKKYKNGYVGILLTLVVIAILLEATTWFIVLRRRRSEEGEKPSQAMNGANWD